MNFLIKFKDRFRKENGDVAIEYFVIAAIIIIGVVTALITLRDELIALIENIITILRTAP
ncbi:MAG: hypothetical protein KKC53_02345 [Actinobacteria bacterium]|nr:hypothetical protein [Actinomycetota bacterium]